MSDRIDLGDPAFEPTDEQLVGLSHRAFAGISAEREAATIKLRSAIAAARQEALRALESRGLRPSVTP